MKFDKNKLVIKYYTGFEMLPFSKQKVNPDLVLKLGYELLANLSYVPLLSSGTLLGLYRNKAFIPHDTDIDVHCLVDTRSITITPSYLVQVIDTFKKNGFTLGRIMVYDKTKVMQLAFRYEDTIFDVEFVYTDLDPDYNITVHEHGYYELEKRYFDHLGVLERNDINYLIPSPIESFLAHRFGSDWKTPKKEKGAWQNDATNLVLWGN